VRTRCDDGAQDGAVVVPLLEPECNHEERERGQHRKRHAHVQRGLTEDKGLPHAQGLERRAGGEDLRLHECTVERCPQVAWHIRRAGGLSLFLSLVLHFAMASTLVPGPSASRDIARGALHVPARHVSPTARVRQAGASPRRFLWGEGCQTEDDNQRERVAPIRQYPGGPVGSCHRHHPSFDVWERVRVMHIRNAPRTTLG
jgi:hypothetical protein